MVTIVEVTHCFKDLQLYSTLRHLKVSSTVKRFILVFGDQIGVNTFDSCLASLQSLGAPLKIGYHGIAIDSKLKKFGHA